MSVRDSMCVLKWMCDQTHAFETHAHRSRKWNGLISGERKRYYFCITWASYHTICYCLSICYILRYYYICSISKISSVMQDLTLLYFPSSLGVSCASSVSFAKSFFQLLEVCCFCSRRCLSLFTKMIYSRYFRS